MRRLILIPLLTAAYACADGVPTQPADDNALSPPAPQLATSLVSTSGVSVTVLGYGDALDINERGQVVGYSWNDAGEQIAVMWDNGEMIDLGAPAGVNLRAVAINNRGQIAISVPRYFTGDAYLWEAGELTLIAHDTRVSGINARGQVVGHPAPEFNPRPILAFVWENGEFTYIDPLPGDTDTRAFALNDAGQVVGISFGGGSGSGSYVWEHGVTRLLPTPPGYVASLAYSINNGGDAAGNLGVLGDPYIYFRAAVWLDGTPTDIGTLGSSTAWASDMNERGQVVGGSRLANGWRRPFLWPDAAGQMVDLGRPVGDEYIGGTEAHAINNQGQVVGGGGRTLRAYMWEP